MAEGQQLNSLDRFRKQPGRLILEEHSHCEVPAGCGGVVLRWRNPATAVPALVHLYAPSPASGYLDGGEVRTASLDLTPGQHVLTLRLEAADPAEPLFMFALRDRPGSTPEAADKSTFRVTSAADGTWKFARAEPPADWTTAAFDDRDWPALLSSAVPEVTGYEAPAYQYRHCRELGAEGLGLPAGAPAGRVWVRKVFEVPTSAE